MHPPAQLTPEEAFIKSIRGRVYTPNDPEFATVHIGWNASLNVKPRYIVLVKGVADVIACVNFARSQNIKLCARCGGHSMRGLVEDGLVVDLRLLSSVQVDAASQTVWVGGGALLGDVDAETALHNLVIPAGIVSHTGVGGLGLVGGFGWLDRSYGFTVDHILEVELVTSDGKLIYVTADNEHKDLLWGMKGAGPAFGIATRIKFKAERLATGNHTVFAGTLFFPWPRAEEILTAYLKIVETTPAPLTIYCIAAHGPDGNPCLVLPFCYNGAEEKGLEAVKPFLDLEPVMKLGMTMIPFNVWNGSHDHLAPKNEYYYEIGVNSTHISSDYVKNIVELYPLTPSKGSVLFIERHGCRSSEIPIETAAVSWRKSYLHALVIIHWVDPKDTGVNMEWLNKFRPEVEKIRNHQPGYANYTSEGTPENSYSKEMLERLSLLKEKYDPIDMFHLTTFGSLLKKK